MPRGGSSARKSSSAALLGVLLVVFGFASVTVGLAYTNLGLPVQSGVCGPVSCVTLTIHVTANGVGVSGAHVSVTGPMSSTATTDSSGTSMITNYPAAGASYPATVHIDAYGYTSPPDQTQAINSDTTFPFSLTGGTKFDFSFPIVSGYPSVQQGSGIALTVQVSLLSGVTQTVTLSNNCASYTGISCPWSTNSGNPTFSATLNIITSTITPTGSYPIQITANSAGHSPKTTTVTLTVTQIPTAHFDYSLTQLGGTTSGLAGATLQMGLGIAMVSGNPEQVGLSYTPSCSSCSLNPTSGTPYFNAAFYMPTSGVAPGSYPFTINAISHSGVAHSTSFTFVVNAPPTFDFGISPGGQTQVQQGQTATISVPVTLTSGNPQQVSLSYSNCPSGVTCNLSPQSGTPYFSSAFTFATSTSTPIGSYTVGFTGTGGGQTHTSPFTFSVVAQPPPAQKFDFAMTQPGQISVTYPSTSSGSTSTLLALTSDSTTTATVHLAVTGCPAQVSCTASPSDNQPPFTATITATILSADAPAGTYTVTVTGVGGSQVHQVTFQLTVVTPFDFSLTSSGSISVQAGRSGTAILSVTPTSGTPLTVALTIQNIAVTCPPQAVCTLTPNSGTPPFQSTLSIATTSSTPPGSYQVIVSAQNTAMNKLKQVSIPITVTGQTVTIINNSTVSSTNTNVTNTILGLYWPQLLLIGVGVVSMFGGGTILAIKPR